MNNNSILLVTPANFDKTVVPWYHKAVSTPKMARFLSTSKLIEFPKESWIDNDWSHLFFMDEKSRALMSVNITRDHGQVEFSMSIHAHDSHTFASKLALGRLLKYAMAELPRQYNARVVDVAVHATNTESLALVNKRFGKAWGVKPLAFWDRGIGAYVDGHNFRKVF